jgi:peptidoglycan DL-endopeptidase CwlO
VKPSTPGVPDRRLILSAPRTTHPLSVKFATVIASSALALGAAVAAATSSAPARPTALPSAGRLTTGRPATGRPATGRPATGRPPTGRPAATHVPRSVKLATVLEPAAGTASAPLTPRQVARQMLGSFGWSQRQFPYLNWLWDRESGWNVYAENPYSGAYGIPQALPGAKMATAGPDWRTSARTQIRWGLRYIRSTYGSPLRAWEHEVTYGWY